MLVQSDKGKIVIYPFQLDYCLIQRCRMNQIKSIKKSSRFYATDIATFKGLCAATKSGIILPQKEIESQLYSCETDSQETYGSGFLSLTYDENENRLNYFLQGNNASNLFCVKRNNGYSYYLSLSDGNDKEVKGILNVNKEIFLQQLFMLDNISLLTKLATDKELTKVMGFLKFGKSSTISEEALKEFDKMMESFKENGIENGDNKKIPSYKRLIKQAEIDKPLFNRSCWHANSK